MGTKFFYALILTISSAILNLLLYFTGFQTEKLATGQYLQWLFFVLSVVILWLGIVAVREEHPAKGMSYGKAVGTGTLISLYSGLMSAVYTFIHLQFVNVSFADYQIELARGKWAEHGMTDAQMQGAEAFTRKIMSPVVQAVLTPFLAVFFGVLISLVLAAFLKRKPAADAAVASA